MSLSHRHGTWTGAKGYYLRLGDDMRKEIVAMAKADGKPPTTWLKELMQRAVAKERLRRFPLL